MYRRSNGCLDTLGGLMVLGWILVMLFTGFEWVTSKLGWQLVGWWRLVAFVAAVTVCIGLIWGVAWWLQYMRNLEPCPHGIPGGVKLSRCSSCKTAVEEEAKRREQEWKDRMESERYKKQLAKDAQEMRVQEVSRLRHVLLKHGEVLLSLSPREFENAIAEMFKHLGYQVTQTPYSNDRGRDAILRKDGKVYLVECKRYGADKSIGRPALQKFFAAMVEAKAEGGFFVTTGRFTNTATEYAKSTKITLLVGNTLSNMMRQAFGHEQSSLAMTLLCEECGTRHELALGHEPQTVRCKCDRPIVMDVTEESLFEEGRCPICAAPFEERFDRCSRYPLCVGKRNGKVRRSWNGRRR